MVLANMPSVGRREVLKIAGMAVAGGLSTQSVRGEQSTQPTKTWPQFQFDAANTGHNPDGTAPTDGASKEWEFQTFAGMTRSNAPVIAGETVVLGARDFNIYGINAKTGEERWRFETDNKIRSTPAIANGRVYFGDGDGIFRALGLESGNERWQYAPSEEEHYHVRVTYADGTIYVPGDGLVALNPDDGSVKWQNQDVGSAMGLAVSNGGVYFPEADTNRIYAFNTTDGSRKWRAQIDGRLSYDSSPVVANGTVFVTTNDGRIHALETASGKRRWQFDVGDTRTTLSTPSYRNGVLYYGYSGRGEVSEQRGILYAIDAASGKEQWRFETVGGIEASPMILNGIIYVSSYGSETGHIYAIDAADGAERWRVRTRSNVVANAAGNGMVYVVTDDGYLQAFAEGSGSTSTPTATPEDPRPTARFTYSPANPESGESITFDAGETSIRAGDIESYEWDFDTERNPGVDATGQRVQHAYDQSGEYQVRLHVTAGNGEEDSTSRIITIDDGSGGGGGGSSGQQRGFFSNSGNEPEFISNPFNLTTLGFLLSVAGIIHQMMQGR